MKEEQRKQELVWDDQHCMLLCKQHAVKMCSQKIHAVTLLQVRRRIGIVQKMMQRASSCTAGRPHYRAHLHTKAIPVEMWVGRYTASGRLALLEPCEPYGGRKATVPSSR